MFLIEYFHSKFKQHCCRPPHAIYVQIWRWWSHTKVYDNTYFHSTKTTTIVLQEKITFLCAQSPIVPHPSGWVFGVKAIHSSPIRIPFHQFASNQVTNSPSKEMGRIREIPLFDSTWKLSVSDSGQRPQTGRWCFKCNLFHSTTGFGTILVTVNCRNNSRNCKNNTRRAVSTTS